jgi:uroporphyrinogen-III synthase
MMSRLAGKRVLVLRPRERSESLCFLLEDEGADVISLPLLELQPPTDPRALSAAAEQLYRYRWVLFASPSAVDAFVDAVREAATESALRLVKFAAVGPATARALKSAGLNVDVEADLSSGEGLFLAIRESIQPGDQLLLPAAEEGRPELNDALLAAGFSVTKVAAYRSRVTEQDPASVHAAFDPLPDVALFGSPRTVDAFAQLEGGAPYLSSRACVAIGPTTAAALREHGASNVVVAASPTAEALVEAAAQAVAG